MKQRKQNNKNSHCLGRYEYAIVQTPQGLEMRQIGSVAGSVVQMIQGDPVTVLRVVGKMTPAEAAIYWRGFSYGTQFSWIKIG